MASRLDRLVVLLETGSTPLIRSTAAQQLADVQKSHPEELYHLLERVVPYLRSKSWETRAAASKALEGIVSHVQYDPYVLDGSYDGPVKDEPAEVKSEIKEEDMNGAELQDSQDSDGDPPLRSGTLNLAVVLERGTHLAARQDRDSVPRLHGSVAGDLLRSRLSTLPVRIGIKLEDQDQPDDQSTPGDTTSGMLSPGLDTPSSLPAHSSLDLTKAANGSRDADTVASTPAPENGEQLSRRQLNMLKRKAKASAKEGASKMRVIERPRPVTLPSRQQSRDASTNEGHKASADDSKLVAEFKGFPLVKDPTYATQAEEEGTVWPFSTLCDYLVADLFDPAWEIRHGAAMGLREVLRSHGEQAGTLPHSSAAQNKKLNQAWLDNVACHLVCLLALDRFADFGSDRAVAPVRETAAQALASVVKHLDVEHLADLQLLLLSMIIQDSLGLKMRSWEVCQGGMLGMKYLVAIRQDTVCEEPTLLDRTMTAITEGLSSQDDDVRAASAATMMPITLRFVQSRPQMIGPLLFKIWDCLELLNDDLSASTGPVMELLAALCRLPEVLPVLLGSSTQALSLVSRLYPFLRHTITSVRLSALRALRVLLISGGSNLDWYMGRTLRLVFQNLILERDSGILKLSLELWKELLASLQGDTGKAELVEAILPHLEHMIRLALHPFGLPRYHFPLETSLLLGPTDELPPTTQVDAKPAQNEAGKRRKRKDEQNGAQSLHFHNVDGPVIQGDVELLGAEFFFRAKIFSCSALGQLLHSFMTADHVDSIVGILKQAFHSKHYTTRYAAAVLAADCASGEPNEVITQFNESIAPLLETPISGYWIEFIGMTRTLRAQCLNLTRTMKEVGRLSDSKLPNITVTVQGDDNAHSSAFSVDQGQKLLTEDYKRLVKIMGVAGLSASGESVRAAHESAMGVLDSCQTYKIEADLRIRAAMAAACVATTSIPQKLGPLIGGLMDAIRKENLGILQDQSAAAIAGLIRHLSRTGRQGPSDKIVRNLAKYLCVDTSDTPIFSTEAGQENRILTLQKDEDVQDPAGKFEGEIHEARITQRGAREALRAVCTTLSDKVLSDLPVLEELFASPLLDSFGEKKPSAELGSTEGQRLIDGLSLFRTLVGCLDPAIAWTLLNLLRPLAETLGHESSAIRYAGAKCFAAMTNVFRVEGFTALIEQVLPEMVKGTTIHHRQGAIETIYHLIQTLGDEILPYVIFLLVPVLGRMSDQDEQIRLLATTSFATLVKLVPLEAGIQDPPGFSQALLEGRERERKFVAQMLDPKKVEPFKLPVDIRAELRPYQQDGVNWLAFLKKYQLHGILCDDMGLGKTLQTLCIVASDHHQRQAEFKRSGSTENRKLPSLIICPPSLSGHWQQEIRTYSPFITPLAYVGNPSAREGLRRALPDADVVITSYEVCRNDIDVLSALDWNYCVLDEGHLIKNAKSKISIAVKRLKSNHRLILSGTPVQNNVVELWSLFDFLMPGFLGTERIFAERYAKPVAASRFAKSSSKEQEAGALAVEALHKQVLPFLLRRLKEEVLEDLPPKIVQNYYCEPSDLQKRLFSEFSNTESKALTEEINKGDRESKQHIFQALQYMRKICNSPALVLKPGMKKTGVLGAAGMDAEDPKQAPKLGALRDLLLDCGIGVTESVATPGLMAGVSQHRALIFCQMREMLDIVQNSVLKKMLPSVQYLRLDGSIEASKRQDIVNMFNADPSYDVLLLTTSVGGLGLNLTGADTVIFMEHDWNPQKDLQAMDRAHRIGQKKVVNVYRLVTRGSIEEKIMNLQRFKVDVAGTVVNQQSNGLGSMQSDELLDLFTVSDSSTGIDISGKKGGQGDEGVDITGEVIKGGNKGTLNGLEELWDENEYAEEYNMDDFLAKMNK